MESYIQISKLNDFIFCPRSVYLHSIYEGFNTAVYHDTPQINGKIKHESIENSTYSSEKRYLQGIPVYSEQYGIAGKIDIYDAQTNALIERKARVKTIYDGYKYQLYAEYFCMLEMGYVVESLFIHSLEDNKRYPIDLPVGEELHKFENTIKEMERASVTLFPVLDNPSKCDNCIYRPLCH